ncbi:unnamed protein product, partial [Chrysoparadoxa australica]
MDSPDTIFNDSTEAPTVYDDDAIELERGMLAAQAVDMGITICPSRRFVLNAITDVLAPVITESHYTASVSGRAGEIWPDETCRSCLFRFVARYLELSLAQVSAPLTNAVLMAICKEGPASQARLVALLSRVKPNAVDIEALLVIAQEHKCFRAAVLLLKMKNARHPCSMPTTPTQPSNSHDSSGSHHGKRDESYSSEDDRCHTFSIALKCYLSDPDNRFSQQVFQYIRFESARLGRHRLDPAPAVVSNFEELRALDGMETIRCMLDIFQSDHTRALEALSDDTLNQFEYLDLLVRQEGTGADMIHLLGATELQPEHRRKYISLLIKHRPDQTYQYLSTHSDYNLDECLLQCREAGINDATAYLLERSGDVTGALALTLKVLDDHLLALRAAFACMDMDKDKDKNVPASLTFVEIDEGRELVGTLQVAFELCQRTSKPDDDLSHQLWFELLDFIIGIGVNHQLHRAGAETSLSPKATDATFG